MGDALQGFVGQVVMHDTIDDGKGMSGSAHIEPSGGVLLDEPGHTDRFGTVVLIHDTDKHQSVIGLVIKNVVHQLHRLEPLAHLASGSLGDHVRFMVGDAGHIGQRTDGAIVFVGDAGIGISFDDLGLDGGHGLVVGWYGLSKGFMWAMQHQNQIFLPWGFVGVLGYFACLLSCLDRSQMYLVRRRTIRSSWRFLASFNHRLTWGMVGLGVGIRF